MPKRTNDFQQLVALVHKALAPRGAKVTESAMVKAPNFGELREIDILLESAIPPYHMKIAIEAKDHKRKLNVNEIEAIIGKYRASGSLVVDRVVVVSRHGFSSQAHDKAKLNGISLLTLSEAKLTDWQKSLPAYTGQVPQSINFNLKPHVTRLNLRLLGNHHALPSGNIVGGRIICRCHRNDFGSPAQFADRLLRSYFFPNPRFRTQFNAALGTQKNVCVRVAWPMARYLLSLDGKSIELAQLSFHVHAKQVTAPLEFKAFQLEGDSIESRVVQHAIADLGGQKFEMVLPDGLNSEQIVIQFGKCGDK